MQKILQEFWKTKGVMEMSNYKVSIIIPVYNSKKFLKEAFESIINQTFDFKDLEIIFINDKSTDGSEDILNEFNEKYTNVFLYDSPKKTKGPGPSRNLGISKATSDYIIFFDSDDIMLPDYIETIYDEITQNNVDLVKTSFKTCINGETFPISQGIGRIEVSHDDVSVLMDYNYFEPWAGIYRKKYLLDENIRFLEKFNVYETFIFTVEAISKAKNGIIVLDDFLGQIWRMREEGLHNNTIKEEDFEYILKTLRDILLTLVHENQPPECIEKLTKFILSVWSYDLSLSKEPKEVINAFCFEKCFKITPQIMEKVFS